MDDEEIQEQLHALLEGPVFSKQLNFGSPSENDGFGYQEGIPQAHVSLTNAPADEGEELAVMEANILTRLQFMVGDAEQGIGSDRVAQIRKEKEVPQNGGDDTASKMIPKLEGRKQKEETMHGLKEEPLEVVLIEGSGRAPDLDVDDPRAVARSWSRALQAGEPLKLPGVAEPQKRNQAAKTGLKSGFFGPKKADKRVILAMNGQKAEGDSSSGQVRSEKRPEPATWQAAGSAEELRKQAFEALRPLCTKVMELRGSRAELAGVLEGLLEVIQGLPDEGLKACMDYVLFPLLLYLEATVAAKSPHQKILGGSSPTPSDQVIEKVLMCTEALLKRCEPNTADQALMLLSKFSALAALPRSSASEEVRLLTVRCMAHIIANSDKGRGTSHVIANSDKGRGTLETLRSEETAPLLGHLLSLMLQLADGEAQAGTAGSKTLQKESLGTLRLLLNTVHSPESLAFFLPGLVSGLARLLSRLPALSSSAAASESLDALTDLLVIVLSDKSNSKIVGKMEESSTVAGALAALRGLNRKIKENPVEEIERRNGDPKKFRVVRDREWLEGTSKRVHAVLVNCLPSLSAHKAPAVRLFVMNSASRLLTKCTLTLEQSAPLLLECLLGLSFDEWPGVATPCQRLLRGASIGRAPVLTSAGKLTVKLETFEGVLRRLVVGLPQAVRSGQEATALLHCQRLAGALLLGGPQHLPNALFFSESLLLQFATSLEKALSFASGGSFVLERYSGGAYTEPEGQVATPGGGPNQNQQAPETPPEGVVVLPRMPPRLADISSEKVYLRIARICRLAGKSAAEAHDTAALAALLEPFQTTLQTAAISLSKPQPPPLAAPAGGEDAPQEGQPPQLSAASAVVVLNEILFGASGQGLADISTGKDDVSNDVEPPADVSRTALTLADVSTSPWTPADVSTAPANVRKARLTSADVSTADLTSADLSRAPEALADVRRAPGSPADVSRGVDLVPFVRGVLTEYLAAEFWNLPTEKEGLSLSELSNNILLQSVLLEGIGVCARVLGGGFGKAGGLMAAVLDQLLDKLGDISGPVSAAAKTALQAIAVYGGYSSLPNLITANSDYVIDILCRQLRHLDLHPRAPQLFVAVLQRAGAGPDLLPLLNEPLRQVLGGLQVMGRKKHPQHSATFLLALRELAGAARLEAEAVAAESADLLSETQQTLDGIEAQVRDRQVANGDTSCSESEGEGAETAEEIRKYFLRRLERKSRQIKAEKASENCDKCTEKSLEFQREISGERDEAELLPKAMNLLSEKKEVFRRGLVQRQRAAGGLGVSAVEACAPLMSARDLRTRMIASDVAERAICTLAAAEKAAKAQAEHREALVHLAKFTDVSPFVIERFEAEGTAGASETNRLLPRVHLLWPHVLAGLRDTRQPVLTRTLELLSSLAFVSGGDFLSRRFQTEAWPLLGRLLREGLPGGTPRSPKSMLLIAPMSGTHVPGSLPRQQEDPSPGASLKLRESLLSTLAVISSDNQSSGALSAIASTVATAVTPFLSPEHPPPLQQKAASALLGLARVDHDAVWCLLAELVCGDPANQDLPKLDSDNMPKFRAILPARTGIGVRDLVGRSQVVRRLLEQVEALEVLSWKSWH